MKGTFLFVCILLLSVSPSLAQTSAIAAGSIYESGTRLTSSWAGMSFVVPAGFRGYYDAEGQGVAMESPDAGQIMGVYGFSEVNRDEMGEALVNLIQEQGIQLQVMGIESVDEQTQKAQFLAGLEGGIYSLFGIVRASEHGNAIGIAIIGAQGSDAALEQKANEVLNTVQWSRPEVPDWRSVLGGKRLSTSGADGQYSQGGAGDASYSSQTTAQIDFCQNGQYGYEGQTESYFSMEGLSGDVSADNSSSDAHQGMWRLVVDLAGEGTLLLQSTDQRMFYWSIDETPSALIVEGTAYSVQQSPLCY